MSLATIEKRKIDKLFYLQKAEKEAFMNAVNKDLENPELMCSYPVQEWWEKYDRTVKRMNSYRSKFARIACPSTITSNLIISLFDVIGNYSKDTFIRVLNAMDIEVVE